MGSDQDGNIYVAFKDAHVVKKFDPTMQTVLLTFVNGTMNPVDVAVDSLGFVYVLDQLNSRFIKFDSDGNFVLNSFSYSPVTLLSITIGRFTDDDPPIVAGDEVVFMSGTDNEIKVTRTDGFHHDAFSLGGFFGGTRNLAHHDETDVSQDKLYIADEGNDLLRQRATRSDGIPAVNIPINPELAPDNNLQAVAVSSDNLIYVGQTDLVPVIGVYDTDGVPQFRFGSEVTEPIDLEITEINPEIPNPSYHTVVDTFTLGDEPYSILHANHFVYVPAHGSDFVKVFDNFVYNTVKFIIVGAGATGIALDSITNMIYVSNEFGDTVSVIHDTTNDVVDTVTVGDAPHGVAFDSLSNMIYVANRADGTVSVINGTDNVVVDTVIVGNFPEGLAFDSNNNMVYVANRADGTVSVINDTNDVVDTITVGDTPLGVVFDSSTNMIYVGNAGDGTVSVIDDSTNDVVDTIPIGTDLGNGAYDMVFNPENNFIYVTALIAGDWNVAVIDDTTNDVVDTISIGESLISIAFDSDSNTIYTGSDSSGDIRAINANPTQPNAIMYVADSAMGETFRATDLNGNVVHSMNISIFDAGFDVMKGLGSDSDGNIYVTDISSGDVVKIDPILSQVLQIYVTGASPQDVAVDSQGFVFIADKEDDRIMKFSNDGNFLFGWGSLGNASGEFDDPVSLYFDSTDTLFVLDGGSIAPSRVQKFDTSGNFISSWNETGAPSVPIYITIDDNDFVYIADGLSIENNNGDNFINKFDRDGNLLLQLDADGSDTTFLNDTYPLLPHVHGISVIGTKLFVGLGVTNDNTFGYFQNSDGTRLRLHTPDLGLQGITSLEDIEIVPLTTTTTETCVEVSTTPTGTGLEVPRGLQQAFDQAVADAIASIQITEQSPLEKLVQTFFDFQILDTTHTDLPLQSFLQNQELGIRWSSGDDIVIVSATPATSPFTFTFEQFPVIKRGSGSFVSDSFILYNLEVPRNQCSAVLTENCVEKIRYEVPITVNAIINKTAVSDTGSITIDLTKGAIDPIVVIMVALTGITVLGAILHKRGGGNLSVPVRRVVE